MRMAQSVAGLCLISNVFVIFCSFTVVAIVKANLIFTE